MLPDEIRRGSKPVRLNRQSAARPSWLPPANRGPAGPWVGRTCLCFARGSRWRPCLRLAPASEVWVSVRRVEAAEELAAEGLHHHFTNPTIVDCSQAGAGTGKADAGRLLMTPTGHCAILRTHRPVQRGRIDTDRSG